MKILTFLIFVVFTIVDVIFVIKNYQFYWWVIYWVSGCSLLSIINCLVYFNSGDRKKLCRVNFAGESPDLLFIFYDKNIIYRSTIGMMPFLMTVFNKSGYLEKPACNILAARATGRKLFDNWLLVLLVGGYLFFYVSEVSSIKAHIVTLFFVEAVGINIISMVERTVSDHG